MNNDRHQVERIVEELSHWSHMDPVNFMNVLATFTDLRDHSNRHIRAAVLRQALERVVLLMRQLEYPEELVLKDGECFINFDGMLIDAVATPFFLKQTGKPQMPIGKSVVNFMQRRGMSLETFVDVGANFGEITLWLSKTYPGLKVLAIEASPENANILEKNIGAQYFSTENISVARVAVANITGTVNFTRGLGTMTHILREGEQHPTVEVSCDRLENLMAHHGFKTADLIKIDVEGTEPLLEDSLRQLAGRVSHFQIEFSNFAPRDDYLSLAHTLIGEGYICRHEDDDECLDVESLATILADRLDVKKSMAENIWFSVI